MWENKLKRKIMAGETAVGPFIRIPSPIGVELAAAVGFDFALLDMEHSTLDLKTVESMILAAAACGIAPVVRVPEPNGALIHQVLDIGAHAVMVPMVNTAAEAKLAGDASKFSGRRGVGGHSRGDSWGALPLPEATRHLDREVLTIVQIESVEAMDNLEAIAAQPGIDMLFVGPLDLSQSMGLPGQVTHPAVVAAILRVIEVARANGQATGIYAGTGEDAAFWRSQGVTFIGSGLDTVLLQRAFKALREQLR